MKRTLMLFTLAVLVAAFFSGCKKDFPEVGDMASKAEGIVGTWKADQVMQVDYLAVEKAEDFTQYDISSLYSLTDFVITFNSDNTFTISGTAPNFARLSSGTWAFDDPAYPTLIHLTDGTASDAFALLAPPKKGWDVFSISYDRYSGGKKIIGYQYHLKRQ